MRIKKSILGLSFFAVVAFFTAAVAICAAIVHFSMQDLQHSQYQERVHNNNVVMSKIGHSIDTAFAAKWAANHQIARRVERLQLMPETNITQLLANINAEIRAGNPRKSKKSDDRQTDGYVALDTEGYIHDQYGNRTKWKESIRVEPGKDAFMLYYPPLGSTADKQLIFITALNEVVTVGDAKIKCIMTSEELSGIKQTFDISNYRENCLSFITTVDGDYLYENGSGDAMAEGWNLLSFMKENLHFEYGKTFDEFVTDIRHGISDTSLVTYNGQKYYMSYYNLAVEEWVSILLVPEENIEAESGSFTKTIMRDIIYICMAIIILFAFLFFYMWQRTVTTQMFAAEAERKANEAKTNFLSSMSHDIRTPMNAIMGMTEIAMRSESVPAQVMDSLHKIRRSSVHMLTLINDILDISKIESGKMTLNIAEYSAAEAIGTMVRMIRPLAKEKDITFIVHTHHFEQENLLGDVLRLNQVCINLLTNAVKYTPNGGKVEFDVWQEPIPDAPQSIRLKFEVRDNGFGMTKEFQKVMYGTFIRETDSRVNTVAGSGLGLAICHQMVQLMGGTISCKSEPGRGTLFAVEVVLERGAPDKTVHLPPLRLLVADHDTASTASLKRILDRLGMESVVVNDRDALLGELRKERIDPFDMAIVELCAPQNTGLAVADALRRHFGEDFPIILTDIADMAEATESSEDENIRDVLNKPYFYSTVSRRIGEELNADGAARKAEEDTGEPVFNGLHLLVAEDNDMNWEVLETILGLYGVTADWAKNGQLCLDMLTKAEDDRYDAVLMDVRMPVMDGHEATRCIRSSGRKALRTIPVIAMTADAFAEDLQACMDAGMTAHLSKPIEMSKLSAVLQKLPIKEKRAERNALCKDETNAKDLNA